MQLSLVSQLQEPATNALNQIASNGILGAIAALAIIGLVLAIIMLLKEKDKRVEEAKKVNEGLATPLQRIQESLERMETKIIVSKARNNNDEGF